MLSQSTGKDSAICNFPNRFVYTPRNVALHLSHDTESVLSVSHPQPEVHFIFPSGVLVARRVVPQEGQEYFFFVRIEKSSSEFNRRKKIQVSRTTTRIDANTKSITSVVGVEPIGIPISYSPRIPPTEERGEGKRWWEEERPSFFILPGFFFS